IQKRTEELKQKADEARRLAFDEESHRLDQEIEQRAQELLTKRRTKIEKLRTEKLKEAKELRQQAELSFKDTEREIQQKLEEERRKKLLTRQRKLEERKVREELERKRLEEEARKKAEEERLFLEREAQKKEEEEKLRKLEEQRQQQVERIRLEEEIRLEKERRRQELLDQARVQSLNANARNLFKNEDFHNALIEVTKVFTIDPENPEAHKLEIKIKEALAKRETKLSRRKTQEGEAVPPIGAEKEAKQKTVTRIIMAAVLLVVISIGIVFLTKHKKDVFQAPVTIAVLPWSSQSAVLEEKILGSSLAEEVAHQLQRFKYAAPMGYSSAYRLTEYSSNFYRSVFELGYVYALQGTLARLGDLYSVDVRLVDSAGNVSWSRRYERAPATLSELPHDIADHLVEALDIRDEDALARQPKSLNPDAYVFYLRGLDLLHRRTPTSMQNALELFDQAIQQDGNCADAHAVSSLIMTSGFEQGWLANNTLLAQAERSAERAISIDPVNDAGYIALGKVYAEQRSYGSALQQFDAALKLAPNNGTIHFEKAKIFLKIGQEEKALEALSNAYKLNPRDPEVLQTYASVYQLKRRTDEGFWYHETALLLVNDSTEYLAGPISDAIMGDAQLLLTYGDRVVAAFERRLAENPNDDLTMYRHARLLQVIGKVPEANDILNKLEKLLKDRLKTQYKNARALVSLALTLTRLGRYREAVQFAQKASELDSTSDDVKYKIAQMYSVQMFSVKKKSIDEKRKEEAVKALKAAVALRYRLDQLTNADFYNMHQYTDFLSVIGEPLTAQ
ncbi:MAG: tetratricopeptide repeat protein, partial [Ignavibacteriae bacterium]|nr:tetratricopeptide repeat protein [Ignavibacteriota bacterium]